MNEYTNKERILDDDRTANAEVMHDQRSKANEPSGSQPERRTLVTPPPGQTTAASAPRTAAAATSAPKEERTALFAPNEANELRSRWDSIQVGFVDEPRKTVKEADELVGLTMRRLGEIFAEERRKMEQQWDRGDNISTEDLRLALQRYRSFFSRLLSL